MHTAAIVTFVYALLLAVGGAMGARAGSSISLIIGLVCALLAAVAGFLLLREQRAGLILGVALAALLLAWGAWSVLAAGSGFMPRGLIACLSLGELLVLAVAARR